MKCVFLLCILLKVLLLLTLTESTENKRLRRNKRINHYEPTWESLDSRPLPNWFDHAKVGIFIHWGVYSVPSMGSEWFWKYLRDEMKPDYVDYMKKNFKPGFTYQDFAKDFTAEHFDAYEWARLFEKSGAKYIVLTSKHHEGFTMWPSTYSFSWNSMDIGPHRDIVGELANAIKKNSTLKFGLYHSLFEWFNPMYLEDKKQLYLKTDFVDNKVWPELKQIITSYEPEILWSDGDGEAFESYWKSKEFLTWLYNESPVRETVVTNDRWGIGTACKHGGFYSCDDRYNPGILQQHKWENAMTIDKQSWGQRANAKIEDFMTSKELIVELVSTVSCGGNILVNVGPTKTGIIEPIFVERLYAMGSWLETNGEAIYDSIPWKHQNDSVTPGIWYTSSVPINGRRNVYAIILEYPNNEDGINLYSMTNNLDEYTKVTLLGFDGTLEFLEMSEAVNVNLPNKEILDSFGLSLAWTLKFDVPDRMYYH